MYAPLARGCTSLIVLNTLVWRKGRFTMTPIESIIRGYAWQGEDDPARLDSATVIFGPGSLKAHGTSRTDNYAMSWALETVDQWITKSLTTTVHGHGWSRQLELERTEDGIWTAYVQTHGETALPPPGIIAGTDLKGALDCDLALCPMTNTMPILRLNLLAPAERDEERDEETVLTMAWVEVPSLRVLPSRQRYGRMPASGPSGHSGQTVRYSSESRNFTTELTVDQDGIVTRYPGLAKHFG